MGLLTGKVAYITGAARGQGRAHAVRLAGEGADIVAIDICGQATPVGYPVANPDDLAETVRLVEALDRRIIAHEADVRDYGALAAAAKDASDSFGRLDIVVANAGVSTWGRCWEMTAEHWQAMIDINLTGVWNTIRATVPLMIEHGNGGSIVLTSSVAGIKSLPGQAHYSAAKHGVVGLCKTAAIELGEYGIRVNSLHPWGVDTAMAQDTTHGGILEAHPSYLASYASILQPGISPPEDMADAVLYLVSDMSKSVTGTQLTVDNGATKV